MTEVFVVSVVSSVLLTLVAWFAARKKKGGALVVWGAALFGVVWSFVLSSEPLLLQVFLLSIATVVWLIAGSRPTVLRVFAVLAMAFPYGNMVAGAMRAQQESLELRKEMPAVTLVDRLAYEKVKPRLVADQAGAPELAVAVLRNLERQEEKESWSGGRFSAHLLALPERAPVEQPLLPSTDADDSSTASPVSWVPGSWEANKAAQELPEAPSYAAAAELHETGAAQFVDPERTGYVEDREHVYGFDSHSFGYVPEFSKPCGSAKEWVVARLELISLLKHAEPRVYMSEYLPRMDELKHAATRPLDAFEAKSLPQLATLEDIVIEESHQNVRMLGALRAGTNCLQCHQVRRGELLGAFSYEIHRAEPAPEKKETKLPDVES